MVFNLLYDCVFFYDDFLIFDVINILRVFCIFFYEKFKVCGYIVEIYMVLELFMFVKY